MNSKITIDVSHDGHEQILLKYVPSEDLRDRLLARFIQKFTYQQSMAVFLVTEERPDGTTTAIIQPLSPYELEDHVERVQSIIANHRRVIASQPPDPPQVVK